MLYKEVGFIIGTRLVTWARIYYYVRRFCNAGFAVRALREPESLCYDAYKGGEKMKDRLKGFDYKTPFFYMVTIKRSKEAPSQLPPFSTLSADGIVENEITRAFQSCIKTFHQTWHCIEEIHYFVIMPDHLHLLVKMRKTNDRVSLAVVIRQLIRTLERIYQEKVPYDFLENSSMPITIFEFNWHDWIVKKQGQLATFIRYIRENPARAWRRRQNRKYFGTVQEVQFLGYKWYAYGNIELLSRPIIYPFQCSRKWEKEGFEWRKALATAIRIGPGCAGISTFMSPCEKTCGNQIFQSGGGLIQLCPEGFGDYWHPTRNKERLCAEGRMLFLTLYPPAAAKPDKATLYQRCHEMGELVLHLLNNQ